jgi:diguanylate cyclase (GGDEF)-like protein
MMQIDAAKPRVEHVDKADVSNLVRVARTLHEARREIDALRAHNNRLLREIAQLKEREEQTHRLADQDELTGLSNRRRLLARLEAAIAVAARLHHHVALLFIDLDGFKDVNDRFGHAIGDALLKAVGARIAARARKSDVVCRYGGDEFVVVLPELSNSADAVQIAETIRGRLAMPYLIEGRELRVTASVGAAHYPQDGDKAEHLLQRADQSMYHAKGGATPAANEFQPVGFADSAATPWISRRLRPPAASNQFSISRKEID